MSIKNQIKSYILLFFFISFSYSNYALVSQSKTDGLSSKKNDTTETTIKTLVDSSNQKRFSGEYDLAFDKLWEALLLAEKGNYKDDLALINRSLGVLYDIYNKDSLALKHFQIALNLSKELLKTKSIEKHQVVSNYFSISNYWRDRKNYVKALTYLDSCYMYRYKSKELPYVISDIGFCNLQLGNLDKAEELLHKGKILLKQINAPYLVLNLSFIGDLKKVQKSPDSALYYYSESLMLLEKENIHNEQKPELLEKLAEIYILKDNLPEAIKHLKASKNSFEELFSATSKHNQRLFEIKNKYKLELAENKILIEKQDNLIKEKTRRFYGILIIFGIIFLAGTTIYILYNQKNKIKKLSLIGKLDKEKNDAILETKNKELTAYALKMIDMEESMQKILEDVNKVNPKEFNSLKNKYDVGSENNWDEFNRRFIEVNTQFYENLCKKHPNLTSTELKHCALIKLHFNSHEMSKVLNISLQSVHTSRYRIRKKMKLKSSDNLETYIGSF